METAVTDRYAQFRGALLAGLGQGHVLVFVTRHTEGQPTAVYRLDLDKGELTSDALPAGGAAIVADETSIYVAGTDGHVHRGPVGGGALSPLGDRLASTPGALALLSEDRLAVRCGEAIVILGRKSGKVIEQLALPEAGTALAADRTGQWLAAGTSRGTLAVFECEEKSGFVASEAKKIHEGAITALLFDPDELRVYSSGSDNRLLLTHVRGELEPEDRAGGAAHENLVQAIALGPEDKVYTAGRDGALKTWTRGANKKRPATLKDGVSKGVALARVEHRGRPHLAILGEDQTIRLFPLDAGGKVGERTLTFHDAYAWARNELAQREPARREAAAKALARYNDEVAIDLLAERAGEDPDHSLKVQAAKLLGESKNPRAVKPLEELLGASEEQVRLAALAGLRALEGEDSWRPLDLALEANRRDVGVAAVQALEARAKSDDQAMERIVKAIDHELVEVRVAALASLEALHDPKGPEGSLIALRGARADVRRLALVRLFQRKLLDHAEVQAAVRRHEGDADADVRRVAFLVSVMSRPALAEALRARDRDMHRQLWELERIGEKVETGKGGKGTESAQPPELEPPKTRKTAAPLGDDDVRPLLEAMASRSLDTCLLGARGLASLQDERAFGTLLQLTNEKPPSARVEACKALAELADPRGIKRLRQMLRDAAGEVRDAAFSALTRLEEKAPLRAAEAGLMAPNEDIRGRGLQLLARQLKKSGRAESGAGAAEKPTKGAGKAAAKGAAAAAAAAAKGSVDPAASREDRELGVRLLERALNDTSAAVRGEAFKAALNLEIGGDEAGTLRFALRSIHAQVRREVLNEVMGRIQEPWAPGLLLELFADPDPALRAEAFEFAQKRGKGKALEPLETALGGRHVDLKLKAIDALSKRRGGSEAERGNVRDLLVRALADEDEQVRRAAVEALVVDEADESLAQAMASPHTDVRVRAAAARAIHGDPRALEPLIALATEKEPDLAEKRAEWIDRVVRALEGLGELGATAALGPVAALVQHKDKRIHDAAAAALGWVSRPAEGGGDLKPLKEALSHPDKDVKLEAALGLASSGDASGIALLKELAQATGDKAGGAVSRGLRASLALGQQADDLLMAFLDHADERIRNRALLLMMLVESSERDGVPDRCLAALSSAHPRVRLLAARALEAFADPAAFAAFVAELLNDRGDDRAPWTLPAETARALAELCTQADPHLRVRAARLLDALDDDKPERFDRRWRVFARRFAAEIAALTAAAGGRAPAPLAYASDELRRVVLGAYAGLSRQGGGALEMRVRQTAITRLVDLARRDAELAPSVLPVLRIALGDAALPVRKLAFESLQALGMSSAALGAEALSVGARDMGVAGLKLLAETGDDKARLGVLERVMLHNTDGLEEEAAKLIAEQRGWATVHAQGLEAKSPAARERSVAGLGQSYEQHESARTALRGALGSRYHHVRERAALELAGKKDAAAFDALTAMLASEQQSAAIDALTRLGDPRTPGALLDRLDKDPAGTARTDDLLRAAGSFRIPASADRLLGYLDDKKTRRAALQALLMVSGHDQPILEQEDDSGPPAARGSQQASAGDLSPWEKSQRPRHDGILARLLDAAARLGDAAMITTLVPSARWARGPEVDPVLAPLASFSKDDLRDLAVEALGFRLRRRGGSADPLVVALAHSNPATQLLAAEGLALGGRADGLRVLLTAIDLAPELDDRRRAVRALGRLGDARALDVLLRHVNEEGHALQEEAAEAIGHLRATAKAPSIEDALLRLAKGSGGVALQALAGLRWFGSAAGWALIRARAGDELSSVRRKAVELLAHDADPASRDVLVSRIEQESDWHVARGAAESLRKLEGWGSLEPDYVLVRSYFTNLEDRTVQRLRERGDPARVLELLPKIHASNDALFVRPLVVSLLVRDPLPVAAAAASLESPHERIGGVAAQILGRAGKAAAKTHGKALAAATQKAAAAWKTARAELDRTRDDGDRLGPHTERWRRMIWACGKVGVGEAPILEAASLGDDPWAEPVRIEALAALATGVAGEAGIAALSGGVVDGNGRQRTLAAAALAEVAPDRASALVPGVLDDRSTLDRLLRGPSAGPGPGSTSAPASRPLSAAVSAALRGAAASVHTQGVALPHLVATADVEGLSATLANKKLAEPARLGALEALARIATDAAMAPLLATAKSDAEDEEIRKAAWRGLRRANRQRKVKETGRVGPP